MRALPKKRCAERYPTEISFQGEAPALRSSCSGCAGCAGMESQRVRGCLSVHGVG
jgi:hypothetical protein